MRPRAGPGFAPAEQPASRIQLTALAEDGRAEAILGVFGRILERITNS